MKKIAYILFVSVIFIACNQNSKKQSTEVSTPETEASKVAANYKSIEVDIEGMTCEIGCARTIQSKLSKVDGVTYSKVDFESKKGVFTYDENTVKEDEIVNKINGIAGGDVYEVVSVSHIEKIIEKTE